MSFRRKAQQQPKPEESLPTPYDPVWGVPARFNAVHDVVDAAARDQTLAAVAHVSADGTIDVSTFLDVARESSRWSRLLLSKDVAPGDRVLVALEPGSSWVAVILGAMRIGAIPVPIGAGHEPAGLVLRAELVQPSLLVVEHLGMEAGPERPALFPGVQVLAVNDTHTELVRPGSPTPPRETAADSPAVIAFTRGRSTGSPRPVLHAHAAAFAARRIAGDWIGIESGDVVWCAVPGGSASALWTGLFGPWQLGATVLLIDSAVPDEEKVAAIERFAPTALLHTPARIVELLDLLDRSGLRFTRLRSAGSTDDPLDTELAARFARATGVRLLNGYGTTETGTLVYQTDDANEAGSIGMPSEGVIVSPVDEEGYVAPDGIVGDLAVYGRPATLCLGYWEEGFPDTPSAGGDWWTLTGDRASFDQTGRLWLEPTGPAPEGATAPPASSDTETTRATHP